MNTHKPTATRSRGPGRPREFDMDKALDGAIRVFREGGYHATSIADLCSAMQLTPGSIYKAFSDKRAIFLAAFERYTTLRLHALQALLDNQPSGAGKIRAVLSFYAESSHGIEGQCGCLVTGSVMALATFDEDMAAQLAASLRRLEQLLVELVRLGQTDGSVAAPIDADSMARTLLSLLQGFRVIGKLGRTRSEMMAVVNEAMGLLA
jgi:TetR/AcrR family transcriptional repressor of nem operon